MKTLTQAEFDQLNVTIENEYRAKDVENYKKFVSEVNKFYPCEIEYSVSLQDGTYYFEHVYAKIKSNMELYIFPLNYQKKIRIHGFNNYKDISHYDIEKVKEGFIEPKQIGVMTAKKIQDWVTYQEQVHAKILELSQEQSNHVAEFLKSIEGMDVYFWDNGNKGEIRKGGLMYKFEIDKGYISEKIVASFDENTSLDVFLRMSDNKY